MAEVEAETPSPDVDEDEVVNKDVKTEKKQIQCPVEVVYCGECSLPVEYCEYHPNYEKCKAWLEKNFPDLFEKLTLADEKGDDQKDEKNKRQKRGGKGVVKTKKKTEPQTVTVARVTRNKKKFVTVIRGLATHDIELKKASKQFANHFSCGSAVTAEDEIVIQGDVTDEVIEFILKKFPQIDEDSIEDLGDQKR
ncbi:Density-regulated protein [Holothuria leucospilota]|uniref:Density-regulated protein n=1 Tax=Holothuria leucospilota TaxID=206669 RepID=A0A9Q1CEB3_HOLLE|nr:Density-regulated protein [Holothuria leucospilota]